MPYRSCLALALLLLSSISVADDFTCSVNDVDMHVNGSDRGQLMFVAETRVRSKDHGDRTFTLGEFPYAGKTLKELLKARKRARHAAERVCSKWTDKTEVEASHAQATDKR